MISQTAAGKTAENKTVESRAMETGAMEKKAAGKKPRKKLQPDWWSKSVAGAVLGLGLALALSGLFAWLGPGGIGAANKVQFNMWIIAPLWMLVFSFVYLIPSGRRALLWLGSANLLAYGLLLIAQGRWPL